MSKIDFLCIVFSSNHNTMLSSTVKELGWIANSHSQPQSNQIWVRGPQTFAELPRGSNCKTYIFISKLKL